MKIKVTNLFLMLILVMFILCGCAIGSSKNEVFPPKFNPALYPDTVYYVGLGIAQQKNEGIAREEAKLKAKERLVSQITQTTISSNKLVLTSDDGSTHESQYKEMVNESFMQEIEGVTFIEEAFRPKSGEQMTYAVLATREWETQKLTKIDKERMLAQAILSERYPGIPPTKEIIILTRAIAFLEERVWGALVEDRFDDTHGNLLSLSKARLSHLYPQVLQSTRVYHVFEGVSSLSQATAKNLASSYFQSYLGERLLSEYRPKQIRYGADYDLKEEITEYINSFMNKHPSLFEYFPGPDSLSGSWQVYLAASKAMVDEMLNKDIDSLYLQVHSFKQELEQETTVVDKLALLGKIKELLSTSFIGLAVEEDLFPNGLRSIQSIENSIIKSVQLMIDVPPSAEKGTPLTITARVRNSMNLETSIPVFLEVTDTSNRVKFEKQFIINASIPQFYSIDIPSNEKTNRYIISLTWEKYPDVSTKETVTLAKLPIVTRFLNFFGLGKDT